MITKVYRGETWLARDEESGKKRPFLIVSEALSGIDIDVTVLPITTKEKRNSFDIEAELWKEAGFNKPSLIRCSKVHFISHRFLIHKLGHLDEQDLVHVNDAMREYLGL